MVCHGFWAISVGVVPDLRRSSAIAGGEAFRSIVLGGALESQGMPNMTGRLNEDEVETIRAYLADRARLLAREDDIRRRVRD